MPTVPDHRLDPEGWPLEELPDGWQWVQYECALCPWRVFVPWRRTSTGALQVLDRHVIDVHAIVIEPEGATG
jgi:hypothetical protein